MTRDNRAPLYGACALAAALCVPAAAAGQTPRPRPTVAPPTPIPTPVPPEREARQNKGAASGSRVTRYENRHVSFATLTRVEEVDLDRDGVFEALVEGVGSFRSLPPDIPVIGFVSRTRLPFENPILAVFKKGKGTEWDLLLAAHLPLLCTQSDDPARCDELVAFRSVDFRYDDRPQVALQIIHPGDPRISETHMYRLKNPGRFDATFSIALPRSAVRSTSGRRGSRAGSPSTPSSTRSCRPVTAASR